MKRKLFAIALGCLAIGLLGSCQKDIGNDNTQQNEPPAGALPGKFSVSADKQVYFSQGNLWYDGRDFHFEDNQGYTQRDRTNPSHVSYFYWSKTASVAYAESYNDSELSSDDVFFTNTEDFAVNGDSAWYSLSAREWEYLLGDSPERRGKFRAGVALNHDRYGLVIAPDSFNGNLGFHLDSSDLEKDGLVFLPTDPRYDNNSGHSSSYDDEVQEGYYWTSLPIGNKAAILKIQCSYDIHEVHGLMANRNETHSIRLVTDVME